MTTNVTVRQLTVHELASAVYFAASCAPGDRRHNGPAVFYGIEIPYVDLEGFVRGERDSSPVGARVDVPWYQRVSRWLSCLPRHLHRR